MTSITVGNPLRLPGAGGASATASPTGNLLGSLYVLLARHRSRQALGRLDDRLLADIGLDREQAQLEAAKPFWTP